MFSHFTLGSNDLKRSEEFYRKALFEIEYVLIDAKAAQGYIMFGRKDHDYPHLFISRPFDDLPATWSNGFHIAFHVETQEMVDRFYHSALEAGGIDDGGPGIRSYYAEDYYAAYVRDPDGNKLQAVYYSSGRTCGRTGSDISHITIGHNNLSQATQFYTAVLGVLDIVNIPQEGDETSCGFGYLGMALPIIYVQKPFDNRPATWGNGTHVALHAKTRKQVELFYAEALKNGGTDEGAPGLRKHYSNHYFAAYVRDPFGNKLQAVCRAA